MAKGDLVQPIMLILLLGVVALYLFSTFVAVDTEGNFSFNSPTTTELKTLPVIIIRIAILWAAAYIAISLASKIGMPLVKRDAFTVVLVMIGLWLLWDKLIVNLFSGAAKPIDELSFAIAKKTGLLK